MPTDFARVRACLKQFAFERLFIEELGWDRHAETLDIPLGVHTHTLTAIAQKRGMVAFFCAPPAIGKILDYATRRRIDRLVSKTHFEHLIVFTDSAKTTQIWQWVKREPSRPAASREHVWHKSQPGDALVQKLDRIAFALEEEEAIGGIADVVGRVRAGFDLEHITKRFYERFKAEHDMFAKFLKGIPDDDMHRWYVSVMLNRLMFIYFVQKKGFLGGDQDYLRNKLTQVRQASKDCFYSQFLCTLFFEGFAAREQDRPTAVNQLLGTIPYLNGGLFMRHQVEELHGQRIQIADAAFEKVFAFFDAYQWHLDERPLRRDDEINPDVLGYIFEKYINQKQMGAYYTKEDITEYIAKNVIIPFLFDAARAECPIAFKANSYLWRLLREDPDRYIYGKDIQGQNSALKRGVLDEQGNVISLPADIEAGIADAAKRSGWNRAADAAYALPSETWREHVARRQRCLELRRKLLAGEVQEISDLTTLNLDIRQFAQDVIDNAKGPELLRAFYQAIVKVTVLDPTCGSGAFLFAALGILEPLYEACIERMDGFLAQPSSESTQGGERPSSSLRETFLAAHGQTVTAIKFADFHSIRDRINKHPNERYFILKSIIVNNLFGVDIMEEAVEICKLRLFLKLVAQVQRADQIEPLPDIDFNIRAGNTLVGYASYDEVKKACDFGQLDFEGAAVRIAVKAQAVEQHFAHFRERQLAAGRETSSALTRSIKQAILTPLNELRAELDEQLANHSGVKGARGLAEWRKSHQPFHWFIEFYGITKAGGFDVIIGNPPYVELKEITSYRISGYKCEDAGNLYALVMERCFGFTSPSGQMGFIVPVSSVSTDRYLPLQHLLLSRRFHYSSFDDRPSRLFDGLEHIRLTIHLIGSPVSQPTFNSTRYNKWNAVERAALFQNLSYVPARAMFVEGTLPKLSAEIELGIADKLARPARQVSEFYAKMGTHHVYYSRKVGYFLQVLNFQPKVLDGRGKKRPPSEFKELKFPDENIANAVLCCLNSNLCYWFITVFSDCRHVNKREVDAFPADAVAMSQDDGTRRLAQLAESLMADLQTNSDERKMRFKHDHLTVQCIVPKRSKRIIDEIDRFLASHYGFTDIELDFIINYDIKYRMGVDESEADSVESTQVFPSSARDRQLCGMFLELVKVLPSLGVTSYLDGLVLSIDPSLCKKALVDAGDRKQYQQLLKKHRLEMHEVTNASVPWDELRQALAAMGAIEIDDMAGAIREGTKWRDVRDTLGALPVGLVALVAKALKDVTENAAGLVGADELKRVIRTAATAAAAG